MGWKKGTTVMESLPLAHVVMGKFKEERCNFCLDSTENVMKKCAACTKVWYCCVACQKGDWKLHKAECPILKRVPDLPTDSMRLYLRLVLRVLAGHGDAKMEKSEKPCLRTFNDLMSHKEDVKNDPKRYALFETAKDFLRAYTHEMLTLPSEDKLLEIFGKMVTNTFTIADESLQDVAVAIYNSPSILDHRCLPNAVASFVGRKLVIRVTKDVDSESYEDLYLSYIDPLATIAERQQQLQEQYYFTCDCQRCSTNDLEEMMLSTEGGSQGEVGRVKACLEKAAEMREQQADPKEILAMCDECLNEIHLPTTNVYVVRLTGAAFDAAVESQSWERAFYLGIKNLKPYQMLQPHFSPCVGYLYANVGKILLFIGKLPEAYLHLRKALEIFSVSLGTEHFLFRQVTELQEQCDAEMTANKGKKE